MLVAKVALGRVHSTGTVDGSITKPPAGFDSIHGNPDLDESGFADNEYCTYRQNAHCLQYLIEFEP